MIRLEAATVLLQWATGGMLFCWFTTRRRVVGLGYGWLLRGTYFCFAVGALATGLAFGVNPIREISSAGVGIACLVGLGVSIARREAGVSGQLAEFDRRSERVAAMTGIDRQVMADEAPADAVPAAVGPEFNPILDLVPALIGAVGLIAAAVDAGGNTIVALLRTLIGAAFIGAISDGMLLGHWYLVQPGLPRRLLNEMVTALGWLWPLEVAALLLPVGMISVWTGTVDDGWGGLLGWLWAMCAITTIVLVLTGAPGDAPEAGVVTSAVGMAAVMVAALTSFVVLFTGYAQSAPRTP